MVVTAAVQRDFALVAVMFHKCGHLCRVSQCRVWLGILALPCIHSGNIWVTWNLQAGWEEPSALGQTSKIHQFWTVSGNVSSTLICYHPNKHLFSAQQAIFPFPGGQEPMPRAAPAAGSGSSASGSSSRSRASRAGLPLTGVSAHMLGHVQQFPLLQLMDWLISQDKLLGMLMHKPRCSLIIWRYLFLPCSPCQGEQAVNCHVKLC